MTYEAQEADEDDHGPALPQPLEPTQDRLALTAVSRQASEGDLGMGGRSRGGGGGGGHDAQSEMDVGGARLGQTSQSALPSGLAQVSA